MQLFQKAKRSQAKADHPGLTSMAEVNKVLADMWKSASAVVKAPYEDKAKVGWGDMDTTNILAHDYIHAATFVLIGGNFFMF